MPHPAPCTVALMCQTVQVLVGRSGTDKVILSLCGSKPFPLMGYDGTATIDVQAGYGVEWCRTVLGVEPEVIPVGDGKIGGRHG